MLIDVLREEGVISFIVILINSVLSVASELWEFLELKFTIPLSVIGEVIPSLNWIEDINVEVWQLVLSAEGLACVFVFIFLSIIKKFVS